VGLTVIANNTKGMRAVTLYFSNNVLMAEFILNNRLSRIETDSLHLSLTGYLTEQQIINALLYYEAELSLLKSGSAS
jgi:hypothetical protein